MGPLGKVPACVIVSESMEQARLGCFLPKQSADDFVSHAAFDKGEWKQVLPETIAGMYKSFLSGSIYSRRNHLLCKTTLF